MSWTYVCLVLSSLVTRLAVQYMAISFPAPTNAEFMLTGRRVVAFVIRSWNNLHFITMMHLTVIPTIQRGQTITHTVMTINE